MLLDEPEPPGHQDRPLHGNFGRVAPGPAGGAVELVAAPLRDALDGYVASVVANHHAFRVLKTASIKRSAWASSIRDLTASGGTRRTHQAPWPPNCPTDGDHLCMYVPTESERLTGSKFLCHPHREELEVLKQVHQRASVKNNSECVRRSNSAVAVSIHRLYLLSNLSVALTTHIALRGQQRLDLGPNMHTHFYFQ